MVLVGCIFFCVIAREVDDPLGRQPEKRGNFALSVSQQPAPLIGFGQNIMDAGTTQFFTYADYLTGCNQQCSVVYPILLHAISDTTSVFIMLPIVAKSRFDTYCSRGVGDLTIQGEYAFFEKNTDETTTMLTCVANISIPTGSLRKFPPTGFGGPGFFLGATASHMSAQWYSFAALGAVMTTEKFGTRTGNQLFYQGGISRNINYKSDHWLFNWMVELDGLYLQRNRIDTVITPNSGGNTISLTPSLWFSTRCTYSQIGISWLLSQHLFGCQAKNSIYAAFEFGVTF